MKDRLKEILEALVFMSVEPLTIEKIKEVLQDCAEEEIQSALSGLVEAYSREKRGIELQKTAGGYVFTTNSEFDPWVRRLLQVERKSKLSSAALETLSVIAYHQPVTQAEISAIRGVDSSYIIKTLLEKKLVKISGRKKAPGRPLIYKTAERFLMHFGLNDLSDLPSVEEISKILEEEQSRDEISDEDLP